MTTSEPVEETIQQRVKAEEEIARRRLLNKMLDQAIRLHDVETVKFILWNYEGDFEPEKIPEKITYGVKRNTSKEIFYILFEFAFCGYEDDHICGSNMLTEYVTEWLRSAIQYAHPDMLKCALAIAEEYYLHKVTFDPKYQEEDERLLKWILKNIEKGTTNKSALLGWQDGPDSGPWPSTKLEDYLKIYKILQENFNV